MCLFVLYVFHYTFLTLCCFLWNPLAVPLAHLLIIFYIYIVALCCPHCLVSILYGISVTVLPTCIFKCAVINDLFLLRYIEFILTVSISSVLGFWYHLYLNFMDCATLLAHADLLEVTHFPTTVTQSPICWALPGCMTSTTVLAWMFVKGLACVVCFSCLSLDISDQLNFLSNFCVSVRSL